MVDPRGMDSITIFKIEFSDLLNLEKVVMSESGLVNPEEVGSQNYHLNRTQRH